MSTDVLGRVVEVVSETTLDRFIEDQICQPLGMRRHVLSGYLLRSGHDSLRRIFPRATAFGRLKDERGDHVRCGAPMPFSCDYRYAQSHQVSCPVEVASVRRQPITCDSARCFLMAEN